ncbi:MAG: Bax inhibitor-1/YccA family protein [Bacteroidetes bacterium]|nr:Bax inhibitor-1/YccA family protein [Bacteroidota bacterium]MCW5894431.1 Bax inhibitor-1/YccA family protein [Bacteroidota bacterium]
MNENMIQQRVISTAEAEELQRAFLVKVYGWMMAGLLITGAASMLTLNTPGLLELLFSSRWVVLGLFLVQIGLVGWLSVRLEKMSAATATTIFVGYAALTGLTLSIIFLMYTAESLAGTFMVTAGTFGVMSAYGYFTKRDLSGLGSFLMMGLIGMILASVVNIFLGNSTVYWITTYIGILIFVGLTAYDTQKIKAMGLSATMGSEAEQKGAIMGALKLYLDFINLFLLLLRVMGKRR